LKIEDSVHYYSALFLYFAKALGTFLLGPSDKNGLFDWIQFHQRFTLAILVRNFAAKNYKAVFWV
jgi:hypothetical protein